jgi:hypothetical protein
MLTLVPIGFNLFAAVVILILSRVKANIGRVWLIAAIFSLTNWGIILGFRWLYPLQINFPEWFPLGEISQRGIFLQLDSISWPLLLALCAVQTAVIITDSSRLDEIPSPSIWSGLFLVYSVGYLAALINSILSILLVWALVDIIEFMILIRTAISNQKVNEIVVSFAIKILGLFFLIFGLLISYEQGTPLSIGQEVNSVGFIVLIAVGLRLGVIPFNLPFVSGSPIRRGLGNSIRMVSVATSIIILLRLPMGNFEPRVLGLLLTFTVIGIFFGAIMWYGSSSELEGRPYWIVSMAGLAIYSSINGNQIATLAWTLALILSGSVLFLYSARGKKLGMIPLLSLIGITGLPFTPSVIGWEGIIMSTGFIRNIMMVLSISLIILGYLRHATRLESLLIQKEKWIWITYPLGLTILIITQWTIFLVSDLQWYLSGIVLGSIVAFLLPIIFYFLIQKYFQKSEYSDFLKKVLTPIGDFIIRFLSFRWIYNLIWSILGVIQKFVNAMTNILEGQGGIIWVIVFLVMIITLITSGDLS